jgi:Ca2+-binding EF-hand superfamily protein
MYFTMTAILMLALLGPGVARADDMPPPHDPRAAHAAADENHDGELDRAEFHDRMVQIFYFADTDKDGFVVVGEFKVFDEGKLFRDADRNRDSKVSLDEFVDARFDNFRAADTNSDGALSVQEVVDAFNE